MKKILLFVTLFYGFSNVLYSQETVSENGVVSFSMPIRNSLKFNRYLINPAFSFVREQNATISFYNKRQWIQFEDAPNTYLFNYSGRFRENEAFAVGLFQQNYGLMTVFGGVANFAHNIVLEEDSNLTFGLNVGAYQSGLDKGKIISDDTSLNTGDYPSNTLLTVNPGVNYGTAFLDFGLSVNNLILYNFGSGMVKDDPERAIEIHGMYTGFIDSYGFFDRSKFSGIVKTELKKDKTVLSGLAMLSLQQGVWAQAGYNTLYGISAGLGVNISKNIAIEYNYERGTGNFTNLGASHEFAIAYKFKNKNYYYGDDEEGSIIEATQTSKQVKAKTSTTPITRVSGAEKAKLAAEAKAKADAEAIQARLAAAEKIKADAEAVAKAKLEADNKVKADAEALRIKLAADAKAKADAEATAKTKLSPEAKAKADAEALRIKLAADAKVKADAADAKRKADAKAKAEAADLQSIIAADAKAKADSDALQAKLAADAKAKAATTAKTKASIDAANKAKLAADVKAKAAKDAALKEKLAADAKTKADAEALQARLTAEAKARADAEALKIKLAADAKAKADAEAQQAKLAADAKAKADMEALQAKLVADARAKADAEATAKLKADQEAKQLQLAEETRQTKLAADAKAKADDEAAAKLKAEQERQAKLAADAKAKADMEALQAKLLADAKVKADAEATAKLKAEQEAKQLQLAEETRQAKLAADAKVKADAEAAAKLKAEQERQAKLAADAKAKADAEALQAKLAADAKAKADAEAAAKLKAEQERQAKLAADAKAKADMEALQAKLLADAKVKADAEATAKLKAEQEAKQLQLAEETRQAKLAADAKVKADAEAAAKLKAEQERQAKLAADAKAKADMEALQAKLLADAKVKADAEAAEKLKAEEETRQLRIAEEARQAKLAADALALAATKAASAPKDDTAKALDNLAQTLESSSKTQNDLIAQFNATVANKQNDLNDLREENDLSEKGIYKEPKPFKSVAAENSQLEALKAQIVAANKNQKNEITKLTNLYNERLKKVPNKNDALNKAYLEKINQLKAAQLKSEQESASLLANLERIKVETEIEKKRRIKRAAYENDQGRHAQDLAALKRIKETTKLSSTTLTESDFDFGEDQSNMQIIKNIKNSDSGYYLIIAVHNSVEKRDEFLTKAVASGRTDVNFFYNVTTSKYYIYYDKFEELSEAQKALETKGSKPYNTKMAIVKVENE